MLSRMSNRAGIACRQRPLIAGSSVCLPAGRAAAGAALGRRRRCVRARAAGGEDDYIRQYPNPQFMEEVAEAFEGTYGQEVADAEEARALIALGYSLLDVRTQAEVDAGGKPRCACHVPFRISSRRYDAEQGKTVVTTAPNPDFLQQVARRFPNPESALLLVADADGRPGSGAQEALEQLDEEGYARLVGLVGGMRRFLRVFDMKLARRPSRGAFVEDPWSEGSSQGMFAGES